MRLSIRDDGALEISEIREIEYYFLGQIPAAADPSGCEAARGRIYPESATSGAASNADNESARDWTELIVPELKRRFAGDLETVVLDLGETDSEVRGGNERVYRLVVPARHAESWYSALNQARLVLAERFDLPVSEDEFRQGREVVDRRWLAFAQSNVYAFIQAFLLDTTLRIPD